MPVIGVCSVFGSAAVFGAKASTKRVTVLVWGMRLVLVWVRCLGFVSLRDRATMSAAVVIVS